MSEKTKSNSIFQFGKTLLLSSLMTMLVLFLIAFISALVLQKVGNYENLYKGITVTAYALIGFISGKFITKRYTHSLLLVLLTQVAFNTLLLYAISAIFTKKMPLTSQVFLSFVIMFAASVLSLFFKRKKQTRNR